MNRLIKIEWYKLKSFKGFWIFAGIYAVAIFGLVIGARSLLLFFKNQGAEFRGLDPTMFPIFDLQDVWQNMAYLSSVFKLFLGCIVVTIVANEIRNRTLRQNIIDGQSIGEYLKGKLLFNGVMAAFSSVVVFLVALTAGLLYSRVQGLHYILEGLQFVGGHFIIIFGYLAFCLMLTLLFPRPGFLIIGLAIYTYMFEPLLSLFLSHYENLSQFWRQVAEILPVTAINRVVTQPFGKYFLQEIQDFVSWQRVIVALIWSTVFILLSYLLLKKKDW